LPYVQTWRRGEELNLHPFEPLAVPGSI